MHSDRCRDILSTGSFVNLLFHQPTGHTGLLYAITVLQMSLR
jgi:hypothetical protein